MMRGSKARCLLLTSRSRNSVAAALTELATPFATVDAERDYWMPEGFEHQKEARLDKESRFLSEVLRKTLRDWWLAFPRGANTPNWDLASTCTIEEKRGLLLVEAKGHDREAKKDPNSVDKKNPNSVANDNRIRCAMAEANAGLNGVLPGWSLRCHSHYQLCNRFAWSWKLAMMGIPVVLVYLGFLDVNEMADEGKPFASAEEWRNHVLEHSSGIVPSHAWGVPLEVGPAAFHALIGSMTVSVK